MRRAIVPAILAAVPCIAQAQPVSGVYVGAGAGLNFMQMEAFEAFVNQGAYSVPSRLGPVAVPASSYRLDSQNNFYPGAATVASIGYGFGNGVRLEVEADYRYNAERSGMVRAGVAVREQKFGAMANALFDMDIGSPSVFPYLGGGIGAMRVDRAYGPSSIKSVAYQGIGGVAFPMPWVPGLSLTLEYRFMGLMDAKGSGDRAATATTPAARATASYEDDLNHSLLVGLRYAFGGAGR